MSVRSNVMSQFEAVAREQNKKLAPLSDGLLLLESGLDSLCFAIVVARLDSCLQFEIHRHHRVVLRIGDMNFGRQIMRDRERAFVIALRGKSGGIHNSKLHPA